MNKPLKSIARISVVDQAIQNLQNYITDNNLQPGDNGLCNCDSGKGHFFK